MEKNQLKYDNLRELSEDDVIIIMSMGLKCFEYLKNTSLDDKVIYELKAKDEAVKTAIECVVLKTKSQVDEIEAKNQELN